jgi:hypothetical protein
MKLRHLFFVSALVLVGTLLVTAAAAQKTKTTVAYNTIPKTLPGNVPSVGPEAYAFIELGDGLGTFAPYTSTIGQVTVVLSSWACQSGTWQAGCDSGNTAKFSQDITFNLYAVSGDSTTSGPYVVQAQLESITKTFSIPYRPSATPSKCSDASQWYSKQDKTCYNGIAVPVMIDFSSMAIAMPANGLVAVTVAYNTSNYGPNPLGTSTACYTANGGCPYDSLNISTYNPPSGSTNPGFPLDVNGIFVSPTLNYAQCSGELPLVPGSVQVDTGCWGFLHPEISLTVNK